MIKEIEIMATIRLKKLNDKNKKGIFCSIPFNSKNAPPPPPYRMQDCVNYRRILIQWFQMIGDILGEPFKIQWYIK